MHAGPGGKAAATSAPRGKEQPRGQGCPVVLPGPLLLLATAIRTDSHSRPLLSDAPTPARACAATINFVVMRRDLLLRPGMVESRTRSSAHVRSPGTGGFVVVPGAGGSAEVGVRFWGGRADTWRSLVSGTPRSRESR